MFFVQSVAALPLRPVAQWGGVSAGLIGAAVVVATTLKIKRLERIRNRLKTESMQHLKGQDRLKAHMKLHELENSLENVQFYKTLGIAALAGGALVAGAGWLWPKDDDDKRVPLGSASARSEGDSATAGHLVLRQEGEYLVAPLRPGVPTLACISTDGSGLSDQEPLLITVPGDGHCLIHSVLFFDWLEQARYSGLPQQFVVSAPKVAQIRQAIVRTLEDGLRSDHRTNLQRQLLAEGDGGSSLNAALQAFRDRVGCVVQSIYDNQPRPVDGKHYLGVLEIQLLATLLQRPINVYERVDGVVGFKHRYDPQGQGAIKQAISICHVSGNHWQPLVTYSIGAGAGAGSG